MCWLLALAGVWSDCGYPCGLCVHTQRSVSPHGTLLFSLCRWYSCCFPGCVAGFRKWFPRVIFRGGRFACLYYCWTDSSAPLSTNSPAPFVPPGVSCSTSTQCNFMSQYCVHPPAMGHDQPQKHGFQNMKGVVSQCAGAFSVGNDCVHGRTACECRKFSSVDTPKVLFFRMVPCFFRFAGGIRVCSAGALFGFSEMLSRAQMGGGLFFSV